MTPGEHWWIQYAKKCQRMSDKQKCVNKFNKYSREKQKIVYRDTVARQKDGWEDKEFIPGPYRYLNSEIWADSPMVKPKMVKVRDTTNEEVNQIQEIDGYKKMIEMAKRYGGDLKPLEAQLKRRLERI